MFTGDLTLIYLLLHRKTPPRAYSEADLRGGLYQSTRTWKTFPIVSSSLWAMPRSGPLVSRGWVLQEQILSPRILHFTETEIFWQCKDLRASETCPLGIFQDWKNAEIFFDFLLFNESRRLDDWLEVVGRYNGRRLTKQTDRLIAISSIARRLQENCKLSEDDYIVGAWRKSLTDNLLWARWSGRHTSGTKTNSSWSWVSNRTQILWLGLNPPGNLPKSNYRRSDMYDLQRVIRLGDQNPFGPNALATLVMHCALLPIQEYLEQSEDRKREQGRYQRLGRTESWRGKFLIGNAKAKAEAYLDGEWEPDKTYLFAPLSLICINYSWQRQLDMALEGLVLQHADRARQEYVRVGVARIEEINDSMKELERMMIDLRLLEKEGETTRRQSKQRVTRNKRGRKSKKLSSTRDREYFESKVFMLTEYCLDQPG